MYEERSECNVRNAGIAHIVLCSPFGRRPVFTWVLTWGQYCGVTITYCIIYTLCQVHHSVAKMRCCRERAIVITWFDSLFNESATALLVSSWAVHVVRSCSPVLLSSSMRQQALSLSLRRSDVVKPSPSAPDSGAQILPKAHKLLKPTSWLPCESF